MKTIKVIDLLVNIANGKEVPKKIIHNMHTYEYNDYDYYSINVGYLFNRFNVIDILNEEVEIVEDTPKDAITTLKGTPNSIRKSLGLQPKEDKKIEYIDYLTFNDFSNENKQYKEYIKELKDSLRNYHIKNNKLINKNDRLNNIINELEKFFKYEYDNEVKSLNDRKISVWTICLEKLQELKEGK